MKKLLFLSLILGGLLSFAAYESDAQLLGQGEPEEECVPEEEYVPELPEKPSLAKSIEQKLSGFLPEELTERIVSFSPLEWEIGFAPGAKQTRFAEERNVGDFSAMDANSRYLAVGTDSGNVIVWDMINKKRFDYFIDGAPNINSLRLSPSGNQVVLVYSLRNRNVIIVYNLITRTYKKQELVDKEFPSLCFSLNGEYLIGSDYKNKKIEVINAATLQPVDSFDILRHSPENTLTISNILQEHPEYRFSGLWIEPYLSSGVWRELRPREYYADSAATRESTTLGLRLTSFSANGKYHAELVNIWGKRMIDYSGLLEPAQRKAINFSVPSKAKHFLIESQRDYRHSTEYIALSPDGTMVAFSGERMRKDDNTERIVDIFSVKTKEIELHFSPELDRDLYAHYPIAYAPIAFSAGGRYLVSFQAARGGFDVIMHDLWAMGLQPDQAADEERKLAADDGGSGQ